MKAAQYELTLLCQPRLHERTAELILYPMCSNRFSAMKVLSFNLGCCTYSVYAMTVQSYLGSSS